MAFNLLNSKLIQEIQMKYPDRFAKLAADGDGIANSPVASAVVLSKLPECTLKIYWSIWLTERYISTILLSIRSKKHDGVIRLDLLLIVPIYLVCGYHAIIFAVNEVCFDFPLCVLGNGVFEHQQLAFLYLSLCLLNPVSSTFLIFY